MKQISRDMQACIDACLGCYQTCLGTAMTHCLSMGGKHVEPKHFQLMMACAEMCRTSAHFMLIGSEHHKHTCRECAEICEECATDCDRIGDMQTCLEACRRCAEYCRKMAANRRVSELGSRQAAATLRPNLGAERRSIATRASERECPKRPTWGP